MDLKGRGGGKEGGGIASGDESPNTLRSNSLARIVDIVAEGPIGGLVDGYKSIYFDDTPVMNPDGSYNFNGVVADFRNGYPTQEPLKDVPYIEAEIGVGVEVKKNAPVTRTINDEEVDAVRVSIRIPSMVDYQDDGDIRPTNVTLRIECSVDGGPFNLLKQDTIEGKSTSPYEKNYVVNLPPGGPSWDLRVVRVTDDSNQKKQRQTFWSSYTKIIYVALSHPDTALCGLKISSKQFGTNIPVRSYEIYGLIVKVPTNYDPNLRTYSGLWDGTFKLAWTDNPAWVLYDILTNDRYGLGSEINVVGVDKWNLYTIAQYCDQLIPDGLGGTEPRFTFNGVINTRQEAFNLLTAVASTFRSMCYYGADVVAVVQDAPRDPERLVAPANVINGLFDYSGSALKSRHSVILVTWNDPEENYKASVEVVEDPDLIQKFGVRQKDVLAFGCTSRGQAVRLGKWMLETQKTETETVTYRASYDHLSVRPGSIVTIHDPSRGGARWGGRVKVASTDIIELDAPVTLDSGVHEISVVMPNGEIITRNIVPQPLGFSGTRIYVTFPLPEAPRPGALWSISGTELNPRPWRVVLIREIEHHVLEVLALQHDPQKYDRVEYNLKLDPPDYTLFPTGPLKPPSQITVSEALYKSGSSVRSKALISWTPSPDPRTTIYEVQVRQPLLTEYATLDTTQAASTEMVDTVQGEYLIRVRSLNNVGRASPWVETRFVLLGLSGPPSAPYGMRVSVVGDQAYLTWNLGSDLDLAASIIKYTPRTENYSWTGATAIVPRVPAPQNHITVPALVGTFMVKSVDQSGTESLDFAAAVVTTPGLIRFNFIEEIEEAPSFSGAKTNCVVVDNKLRLSLASAGVHFSEGTYTFSGSVDLTEVYSVRLRANVVADLENIKNTMSTWLTLRSVKSLSGAEVDDGSIILEVRTTSDDPTSLSAVWSDWQEMIVGDYTARAFQARVKLTSRRAPVTPVLSSLSLIVDMPDRVTSGEDVLCNSAGIRVPFVPPFLSPRPAVAVTAQDLVSGDRYAITSQDATGFNIRFYNSSDTPVARTFDWIAKGYGYRQ